MKVILLKDVPKVGRKFTAVDVSDGYAANFLFPKKLAEAATPAKLAELGKREEASRAAHDARMVELREKFETLADETLSFVVKADDTGHLFKKIRSDDIVGLLKDEQGIELDEGAIELEKPIDEVGEYEIAVDLFGEKAKIKVEVVSE